MSVPIVAIVGRPNVGKSTLFNRYAGQRRALVEDTPGLTRDRIAQEVEVGGRRILLVDTAGLDPEADAGLPAAIQRQAQEAMREADAILFVVDGKSGVLPLDAEIARLLRRAHKPVLVAVNKIDTPVHRERLTEFYALGHDLLRAVSAEHGSGAWDALEDLVGALPVLGPAEGEGEADETLLRVALVGRPNVGKSSLLNRLAGRERVVVSHLPGTTRDAVDIRLETDDRTLVLVDTAGLRRVTDQDARIGGLARERGCATGILANKWDLLRQGAGAAPEGAAQQLRSEVAHKLRFMADAPLLPVSARTGAGLERVFPLVWRLEETASRQIPTADLNRWLRETVERHEPAMAQRGRRRRPLKFFYATQTGTRPPTFLLFCTDPAAVQVSYRRFLVNQLRKAFDLAGTPVRLRLRSRHQ
jgi:GTP-binding protein